MVCVPGSTWGCRSGQRGKGRAGGPSCPRGLLQSTQELLVLTSCPVPPRSRNVFTKSLLLREQTCGGFC